MHSFTTFFIAATLALTALVSAATIGKEDLIFDPIGECVDHINIIKNRLELLNAEYTSYHEDESSSSSTTALLKTNEYPARIYGLNMILMDDYTIAKNKCCPVPANVSTGIKDKSIFNAVDSYTTTAINVFDTLTAKRDAFNEQGASYMVIVSSLSGLRTPSRDFQTCLESKLPDNDLQGLYPLAQSHISFDKAYSAFDVNHGDVSESDIVK